MHDPLLHLLIAVSLVVAVVSVVAAALLATAAVSLILAEASSPFENRGWALAPFTP